MCPPQFTCCHQTPNVTVLGGRDLGRRLGHEGGASASRIRAFIRRAMRETISLSAVWAQLSASQAAGLSRHRVCQPPDPGRATLQNHERDEYMTVGQAPGLWYSCCSSLSRHTAPEPTLERGRGVPATSLTHLIRFLRSSSSATDLGEKRGNVTE